MASEDLYRQIGKKIRLFRIARSKYASWQSKTRANQSLPNTWADRHRYSNVVRDSSDCVSIRAATTVPAA